MERYIGLDAHGTSCTLGVIGPSGRKLRHQVVETNGSALVSYLRSIPGRKHLCLEEGTQSSWLYEILEPHVEEIVVAMVPASRGQKSDEVDAFQRAEELRTGAIKTSVYKAPRSYGRLRELACVYSILVKDVVRIQLRLKAKYRSRGVATPGTGVYGPKDRDRWLQQLPARSRFATEKLHETYDALLEPQKEVKSELLIESRKHRITKILKTAPGMGRIRVALLLPIVVTPHRFRTRSQFWAYCGLAVVTRSSSDWVRTPKGWKRANVQRTRGLNRNRNSTLKNIFKGAAMTIIMAQRSDEPLYEHYVHLTSSGTRPNLAKLTIARRVAAIVLRMWKDEQEYDPGKLNKNMLAAAGR